jgi:ParB family chromosome partitioning protein
MARHPERRTLGRGLSSLLGDVQDLAPEAAASTTKPAQPGVGPQAEIAIDLIHPNPEQPRRHFPVAELQELADSIRERGLIQPVVLRPHPEKAGAYQIVAGERRWRAAQMAQLHKLPAVVRDLDDRTVLEIAIVENVQRQDLDPLEEAAGYKQLIDRFGYTQEAVAAVVGKSRSHLANTLRLAGLPEGVRDHLRAGRLSAGHARALLGSREPEALAERVVREGMTVRQVEALVKAEGKPVKPARPFLEEERKDADTRILEGDLSAAIGMRVRLADLGDGAGEVRIRYRDSEELERLCEKLAR